jgi:hypothetical protein
MTEDGFNIENKAILKASFILESKKGYEIIHLPFSYILLVTILLPYLMVVIVCLGILLKWNFRLKNALTKEEAEAQALEETY